MRREGIREFLWFLFGVGFVIRGSLVGLGG